MSISLVAVDPRSNRRLRLAFSETLAAGAFAATAFYSVSCTDGVGVTPTVVAVFALPGSGNVCEIALGDDLTDGAAYSVSAVGVPASGGGTTPADSTLTFRRGVILQSPRAADTPADDILTEVYGEDLVWLDGDMAEDASGDLATIGGVENVDAALARRIESDGLDWDENYGGKLRQFVDGPAASAGEMRGICTRQLLRDDRVLRASTTILTADLDYPEETRVECAYKLVGDLESSTTAGVRTA